VSPGASILGSPPAATYPAPSGSGGAATTPADQPPSLNTPAPGNYQGSSYRPAPAQPITPPQAITPPTLAPPPSNSQPTSEPQPPRDTSGLQLIPYPGDTGQPTESSAPPLLNPRGKTASFRRAEPWSYAPIRWSESSEVRQASAAAPAPAIASEPISTVDDGGWRPARSR
jgi:hypothetical protein